MKNLNEKDIARLVDLMEVVKDMPKGHYRVLFNDNGEHIGFVIHNDGGVVFVPRK